jgi:glycopeptide antibiotics resistance protein
MSAPAAHIYRTAALGFAAIAILGSLQPFRFHAVPLTTAIASLWDFERIGPVAASDVFANCLLFVPLGLFGSAAFGSRRTQASVVVAVGIVLSVAIELAQAFVSWRTPSIIDVSAEGFGTVIGVALWRVVYTRVDPVVALLTDRLARTTSLDRLVLVYVAGLSALWLAPFDFTIRPSELAEKYERLRLLLPFSPSPYAATTAELLWMVAAVIPVGMAGVVIEKWRRGRASISGGLLAAVCWIAALTCAQVFVASRTTDSTVMVAALPGLTLGAVASGLRSSPR